MSMQLYNNSIPIQLVMQINSFGVMTQHNYTSHDKATQY